MIPTQEPAATPGANARSEQAVNRAGEQLGRLAGRAILRAQQIAQNMRTEADEMDNIEPSSQHHKGKQARTTPPSTERAEEMVDHFLQRTTNWAIGANLQTRRTLARLREDAEDIWVEAQHMRGSWGSKHEGV